MSFPSLPLACRMTAPAVTPTQQELWNGPAAHAWIRAQRILDAMFAPIATQLAQTVPSGAEWKVLDVGCGTGATTLAVAERLGPAGHCTGIDLSAPMIDKARERAAAAGLPVDFIAGDAGRPPLAAASIDHIISRFGVMFFDDPTAAFARLRETARPGGTLHAIAWRAASENPFMTTAERAAAPLLDLPARAAGGPGQFAFADADRVRDLLHTAGWRDIAITAQDVTCTFARADLRTYLGLLGPVGIALRSDALDDATRTRILDTLEAAFAPFVQDGQVRYTAACWVIQAVAPA